MLKRSLTAIVGIPLVLVILRYGGETVFFILTLLVAVWALNEYLSMAVSDAGRGERLGVILPGCVVLLAAFMGVRLSGGDLFFASSLASGACVLSLFGMFCYHLFFEHGRAKTFHRIILKFFGIFYVTFLFSTVFLLRAGQDGIPLVFLLLFVTWAGDTGAYLVGRSLGKTPLCPAISPKKTVEGSVGGLGAGLLTAFICRAVFFNNMSMVDCLVLGAGINILNQIGDLSESMIKRTFDVKDSGALLPGHGGVLDRIDSLLPAAPFLFFYVQTVMAP